MPLTALSDEQLFATHLILELFSVGLLEPGPDADFTLTPEDETRMTQLVASGYRLDRETLHRCVKPLLSEADEITQGVVLAMLEATQDHGPTVVCEALDKLLQDAETSDGPVLQS